MPAPGAAPQPQQAAFGQSPATQPTPNRGYEAAGMQQLGLVVKRLTDILQMVGVGSDPGKDILKAITSLSKHVPPGSVSPGSERNDLQTALAKNTANSAQMQQMRQQMPQQAQPQQPAA